MSARPRPKSAYENNNQYPLFPGQAEDGRSQDDTLRPKPERRVQTRRVGKAPAQGEHPKRSLVRIVSVHKRLRDPDNLFVKPLIDCLRYAGLIPDDSESCIELQVSQRKPAPGEAEHTEVEITHPEL